MTNLPPLLSAHPWVGVEIAPIANGVYDLQLRSGLASRGEFADGYWLICNYYGKPLRMPLAMAGTFVKAWRHST